jgi:hypothetical protein
MCGRYSNAKDLTELICLAADQDWLHKATKGISQYWRNKR